MRRTLSIAAVALASTLTLTGCFGETNNPAPTPTPSATAPAAVNPISDETVTLGEAQIGDDLRIEATQIGVGYPNTTQMLAWGETEAAEEKPSSTPEATSAPTEAAPVELVEDRRVVAVRYDVTNISDSPVDVSLFSPLIGYFDNGDITGGSGKADYSMNSLHGVLEVNGFPEKFAPTDVSSVGSSEWILNPGETVTWAADWLIPETLQEDSEVILTQNFSIRQNEWSSDNKFTLQLDTK